MNKIINYFPIILMTLLLSVSSIRIYVSYSSEDNGIYAAIRYMLITATLILGAYYYSKLFKAFLFVLFLVLFVICNYLLFDINRPYINQIIGETWPYLIATILCGYVMTNDDLVKAFKYSSFIILLCCILLLQTDIFFRQVTEHDYGGVNAVFSGLLLIPAVTFVFEYKWKDNPLYLVPSIVSALLFIVVGGKRIVLISYLLALLYVFICDFKEKRRSKSLMIVVLVITAFILFFPSLSAIVKQYMGVDFYSLRIFDVFGADTSYSGRSSIYSTMFDSIMSFEGIVTGRGMNGDMALRTDHQYSHNFFLELIVEFGLIIGLAIIVAFFHFVIKVVRKRTGYNQILSLLFFMCFLPLMVSGTFWGSQLFWLSASICLNVLFNYKKKQKVIRISSKKAVLQDNYHSLR